MFDISKEILEALGFEYDGSLYTLDLSHLLGRNDCILTIDLESYKTVILDDMYLDNVNTDAKLILFINLLKGI